MSDASRPGRDAGGRIENVPWARAWAARSRRARACRLLRVAIRKTGSLSAENQSPGHRKIGINATDLNCPEASPDLQRPRTAGELGPGRPGLNHRVPITGGVGDRLRKPVCVRRERDPPQLTGAGSSSARVLETAPARNVAGVSIGPRLRAGQQMAARLKQADDDTCGLYRWTATNPECAGEILRNTSTRLPRGRPGPPAEHRRNGAPGPGGRVPGARGLSGRHPA